MIESNKELHRKFGQDIDKLCAKAVPEFYIPCWPLRGVGSVTLPERAFLYLYLPGVDLFEKDGTMLRLERIMGFFGRRTHCEIQNNGRLLLVPVRGPWSMLSSDSWGPVVRLNCFLFFLQFAEDIRDLFIEKVVAGELYLAAAAQEMTQEDVLRGIKGSIEPFLLMRDYLIPRLEKYVGKPRAHGAIVNEFRNAFNILIPYLVADELGKCLR